LHFALCTFHSFGRAQGGTPATQHQGWQRGDYRAAWLVGAVWAVMAAATFWMVSRCALTSPIADELRYVGVVSGAEPFTWDWLVQVENQHFAPLFKLAYLGVGGAAGFDFRAGAFASAGLLAMVSLAMIVAAARLRGRPSELDVIFPVLWLHWGHYTNLIWGFQLFYVLPTVLVAVVLLALAAARERLSVGSATLVAICLLGAALSGGPGIFYVPPLAAWLAYAGIRRWREGQPRSRCAGAAIMVLGTVACLPLVAYVAERSEALRFPAPLQATSEGPLAGTLAFLSLGPGKIGKELWPASGLMVVGLLALAARVLCRRWRGDPQERLAAAGLGLFLFGAVLLAIGTGAARGHMAPRACLQYRYMLLAAPLVLGLYWVGVRYGPAIRSRQLRISLAAAMLVLAAWYDARGWNMAVGMRVPVVGLEEAVAAGMTPREAAVRFADALQDPVDSLCAHLEMLRQARLGPYRNRRAGGRESFSMSAQSALPATDAVPPTWKKTPGPFPTARGEEALP